MSKYLYNFEQHSWREARQMYFDLFDFTNKVDLWPKENSVVGRIKYVVDFLNSDLGLEERIEHSAKHALSMLDTELVNNFSSIFRNIIRWLSQHGLSAVELHGGVEEFIFKNSQLSEPERQEVRRLFSDFYNFESELAGKLKLIIAVIGGERLVFPYTFGELTEIVFEGTGDIDDERFLTTLSEAKYDDKNGYRFVKLIIDFLSIHNEANEKPMEWEEALVLYSLLDVLYYRFFKLTGADRWFVLQNYFYKAIVCDLPVKKVLQDYLRDCDSTFDYMIRSSELKDCLSSNLENVPVDLEKDEKQQLLFLLKNFISRSGGDVLGGYKMEEFLQGLYKDKIGRDASVSWLREAFVIILHINDASLIDWYKDREVGSEERASEDKVKLLSYVCFGGTILHRVVDYFNNKGNIVSLGVFIQALKESIDLTDENMVKKILDFGEVLKENNLLGGGSVLLEFHESDGKFHWNE